MASEAAEPEVDSLVVAVRELDKSFSRWMKQDDQDEFPPALVSSIGVVCAMVTTSFPKDDNLMSLFMACTKLAGTMQDVMNEEPGSATRCVAAIENVVKFLEAHETEQVVPVQPVNSLLQEYKNQPQRYLWIAKQYGDYDRDTDRWVGPFYSKTGIVLSALIEKEAALPGSVLGEAYQPLSHQRKAARIKAEAMRQLKSIQSGIFRPEGGAKPEKATVLEMLQEGQYADVVARIKKVPLSVVLETAWVNGIKVSDREDDLNRAAHEQFSDPLAESAGYVKPPFDEPADDADEPADDADEPADEPADDEPFDVDTVADEQPAVEPGRLTSKELEDFVVAFVAKDNGATAHEILAAAVTETGKSASRQMLTPILKTLRGV